MVIQTATPLPKQLNRKTVILCVGNALFLCSGCYRAPKVRSVSLPGSSGAHTANPGNVRVEGRIPADVIKALEEKGWEIRVYSDFDTGFGGANAIMVDPEYDTLAAGSEPRREGYAVAW